MQVEHVETPEIEVKDLRRICDVVKESKSEWLASTLRFARAQLVFLREHLPEGPRHQL